LLKFPLIATSANLFKNKSPIKSKEIKIKNKKKKSYLLKGGKCFIGIESTIIGFKRSKIFFYRLGAIKIKEIKKTIGYINTT